ncbi:hypothetical protein [Phycicoccus sonneratiae]|uniref:Uncharacterized protein n=1 Tax=Phycicoccus sonneratiae TaxID=2807628 RepID=A0ABS2CPH0_9MICO|nr:hypothetical protein [Phycicoccus sonneraticus]MBM6401782.1 hypothetical protein [Phycicoccus sonneraticus]
MRPAAETAVLREYRHLLRTGPVDWQETAHRHALTSLGSAARTQLLGEVRRLLLVGTRLRPDDVHEVARLLVLAERHRPRILLDGMRPDLLRLLARAVVASPAGRTLAVGRDVWDGTDPLPPVAHESSVPGGVGWGGEWGTGVVSTDLGAAFYGSVPPRRRA